jgi:hypothetical protein
MHDEKSGPENDTVLPGNVFSDYAAIMPFYPFLLTIYI